LKKDKILAVQLIRAVLPVSEQEYNVGATPTVPKK